MTCLDYKINVKLSIQGSKIQASPRPRRPRVLGDHKISEDNQELRPGCSPDYHIFCERIDPKTSIPTNLSSYHSLTNKNSTKRTSTTYIKLGNKLRTTKIMTRTTRFLISVVLRLPTFGSNFATLAFLCILTRTEKLFPGLPYHHLPTFVMQHPPP